MTDAHPHPDLVALLRFELSNAEASSAGEHLDECEECRSDLGNLVVGSSVMGRAARTLATTPSAITPSAPPSIDLPPLVLPRRPSVPRGRWLLAGAAAVTVVVVGVVGAVASGLVSGAEPLGSEPQRAAPAVTSTTAPSSSPEPTVPTRSVELAPPADQPVAGTPAGRVDLVEGDSTTMLTFATSALPRPRPDEFYEAWLLDPATSKMLPLGVVTEGDEATFAVSNDLLDSYAALDLSLEVDDGDPRHSARSVLRGTY